jgi:hypothetical protein
MKTKTRHIICHAEPANGRRPGLAKALFLLKGDQDAAQPFHGLGVFAVKDRLTGPSGPSTLPIQPVNSKALLHPAGALRAASIQSVRLRKAISALFRTLQVRTKDIQMGTRHPPIIKGRTQ